MKRPGSAKTSFKGKKPKTSEGTPSEKQNARVDSVVSIDIQHTQTETRRQKHQHTNVAPAGHELPKAYGKDYVPRSKLKPWNEKETDKDALAYAAKTVVGAESYPTPTQELLRHKLVTGLRETLTNRCKAEGVSVPLNAYERWHFIETMADRGKKDADSLVPSCEKPSGALVKQFVACGLDADAAKRIEGDMVVAAKSAVKALRDGSKKGVNKDTCEVVRNKHNMDFVSGKVLVKLNYPHYDKLRELWVRHSGTPGTDADINETKLHNAIFCLLLRYKSLQGHGFQAAVPEQVFDVLLSEFGCRFECFASPLNCRYAPYASAFLDTDSRFGSVGSFFEFRPAHGVYEVNPPFVAELMGSMVDHMESLLALTSQALCFVVFIPGWTETDVWARLSTGKFNAKQIVIAAIDHGYSSGAQHQDRDRYRVSSFDTGVFFLQNDAGKEKWKVTESVEKNIRKAFAQALPTKQEALRRVRTGKGFGALGALKGEKEVKGKKFRRQKRK